MTKKTAKKTKSKWNIVIVPGEDVLADSMGISHKRLTEIGKEMDKHNAIKPGGSISDDIVQATKIAKNDNEFAYMCFFLGHVLGKMTASTSKREKEVQDIMKDLFSK